MKLNLPYTISLTCFEQIYCEIYCTMVSKSVLAQISRLLEASSLCNRPICHKVSRVSFDGVVNSLGGDSSANIVIISDHML